MYYMHDWCLQRSEEGVRSFGTGVIDAGGLGNDLNQTQSSARTAKCP